MPLSALAIALAAVISGCESAPKLVPKGDVVAHVPADASRPRVSCKVLNLLHVELPRVQRAGDVWTLVLNDERYLDQRAPITARPDGSATVPFLALNPGRRTIRFAEIPPNEKEADPLQWYEILVTIQ